MTAYELDLKSEKLLKQLKINVLVLDKNRKYSNPILMKLYLFQQKYYHNST